MSFGGLDKGWVVSCDNDDGLFTSYTPIFSSNEEFYDPNLDRITVMFSKEGYGDGGVIHWYEYLCRQQRPAHWEDANGNWVGGHWDSPVDLEGKWSTEDGVGYWTMGGDC